MGVQLAFAPSPSQRTLATGSFLFILLACFSKLCDAERIDVITLVKYDHSHGWNYADIPAWNSMVGQNCTHQGQQSPINIEKACVEYDFMLGPLNLSSGSGGEMTQDKPNGTVVILNEHTWLVKSGKKSLTMTLNGTEYMLDQFQFHSPSENTIDGKHFALEAHMIHRSIDGQVAVLSQLFTIKPKAVDHTYLTEFWGYFPTSLGEGKVELPLGNPYNGLLVNNPNYYTWIGSMTTPPCTTDVKWVLMQHSGVISQRQLNLFREALSSKPLDLLKVEDTRPKGLGRGVEWAFKLAMNNRPIQPLGDRVVRGYNPSIATTKLVGKCKKKTSGWSYRRMSDWLQIPGSMCGHPDDQSPVNIVQRCIAFSEKLPELVFNGPRLMKATARTSAHTWELDFDGAASVTFDESVYTLGQLHFRSPSENTIDGKYFPLEIHYVHVNESGNVLMISQMFQLPKGKSILTGRHPYLAKIFPRFLRRMSSQGKTFAVGNPYSELLAGRRYVRWKGSLTTPPCTNNVEWVMMADFPVMSRSQLRSFRVGINSVRNNQLVVRRSVPNGINGADWDTSLGVNNRALQPLASRQVRGFNPLVAGHSPPDDCM
eukprot:TRINITY_DN67610_c0_g1_i1.p1 TRINITY_DN67610_c0_g1~~TRINITY_DN67610_c0_g1_i1.p1  ORF type:complete len:598 (+),score=58.31 TRINITY_DN67610_c0_g1_i1:134-1927(+)